MRNQYWQDRKFKVQVKSSFPCKAKDPKAISLKREAKVASQSTWTWTPQLFPKPCFHLLKKSETTSVFNLLHLTQLFCLEVSPEENEQATTPACPPKQAWHPFCPLPSRRTLCAGLAQVLPVSADTAAPPPPANSPSPLLTLLVESTKMWRGESPGRLRGGGGGKPPRTSQANSHTCLPPPQSHFRPQVKVGEGAVCVWGGDAMWAHTPHTHGGPAEAGGAPGRGV